MHCLMPLHLKSPQILNLQLLIIPSGGCLQYLLLPNPTVLMIVDILNGQKWVLDSDEKKSVISKFFNRSLGIFVHQ